MSEEITLKIEMHMENIETYTRLHMKMEREKETLKLKAYLQALKDAGLITYQRYVSYLKETFSIIRKRGKDENNKNKKPARVRRPTATTL